ncbi:WhiB family transcriptional regulator [Streptomyces sp. NY05-11A]|uniref:WhiB family transcriptional regulator n=1 Tax=Streptomyces soliscabiei TaxID=588897 RepID=UPI0029A28B59|nr:WhiB family transcriptional regulator [Streptomyces sp. NY05-11A]MDX2679452.1 WhiB family transcriptional regulator [Streptomyces sp. NY05-11A]
MASHTVLHARPARGPVRGSTAGAHIPEAALPCQRRPDVFQHPLLEASTDIPDASPDASPEQRHQHLVLLRTARDLCASCPLWAECLQDAVAHAEPYGYAAATTLEDRRWIRRALAIGDPNGNLPTHSTDGPASTPGTGTGPGSGDASRRLLRLRSRTTDAAARHADGRGLPELEQVLDAFDARQEQLASYQRQLPAIPRQLHEHTVTHGTHRHPHPHAHPECRSEDMPAAESGQRIAFSYEDPAQAVRQALLAPLVRSALPALDSLGQVVTMLASVPGGDIAPELPDNLRAVRKAVEALAPEGGQGSGSCDPAVPATDTNNPFRALTGSVSVELATTDPVAALRRDFLEPLLRELASSLANIEKVATMLAATSDGDEVHLQPIRTALQGIRAHLPHPASPSGATTAGTARQSTPLPAHTAAPSIRSAVETAVSTFPGPFSARDVLRALPPGIYGDPSKTISNVLSALVKSGRLQRLARGTYARTVDVTTDIAVDVPDQDEAKSA